MIDVSIPCHRCGEPIRFRDAKCGNCGLVPSRDARQVLHERLVAASSDFREYADQINAARAVLFVVGMGYVAAGVIGFALTMNSLSLTIEEGQLAWVEFGERVLAGLGFLTGWHFARQRPMLALGAATGFWLALQGIVSAIFSVWIFAGLWIQALATLLLVRGIVASARAETFLRRLSRAD